MGQVGWIESRQKHWLRGTPHAVMKASLAGVQLGNDKGDYQLMSTQRTVNGAIRKGVEHPYFW